MIDWDSMEKRVIICEICGCNYLDMVCKTDITSECPKCKHIQKFKY